MSEQITGVEGTAVAGQQGTTAQSSGAGTGEGSGVEKAFAARLAQERQKLETEFKQKYGQKLALAEKFEALGYDAQEVIDYIDQYQQSSPAGGASHEPAAVATIPPGTTALEAQLAQDFGVSPQAARVLVTLYGQVDQLRLQAEASELKTKYPDFDAQKVMQFKRDYEKKRGVRLTLEDAYKVMTWEDRERKGKQEAVSELTDQAKKQVIVGGGEPVETEKVKDYWKLSPEKFKAIYERVRRGEKIPISEE